MNNLMDNLLPDIPARVHLVGIKGQAMTGLAQLILNHGYSVTGSDVEDVFPTDAVLKSLNINVAENFSANNISKDIKLVVYSTAYNDTNSELQQAIKLGIPVMPHPELQKQLMDIAINKVCVSGTHGKTTTTAMLAKILEEAGLNPTALVGAPVSGWRTNARCGDDNIFVLEADEYQNKLQYYNPTHAIVTSVDYDHPDYFPDEESYKKVFEDFVSKISDDGYILLCSDSENAVALKNKCKAAVETYGTDINSNWCINNIQYKDDEMLFDLLHQNNSLGQFKTSLMGVHYALDAAAAIAMSVKLGASINSCKIAMQNFRGTARRQEKIGTYNGARVFDDYAHHPAEIEANINAFKKMYPKARLIIAFEAHTYSRTEALINDFAKVLSKADLVYIPPIFGSAREKTGSINQQILADEINKVGGKAKSKNSFDEVLQALRNVAQDNDVIVTMGAGDIWKVAKKLVQNV